MLALILGSGHLPAAHEQVLDFLQFASARGINVNDLWVIAPRKDKPIWGVLPIVNPGHTALLFAPPRRPTDCDVAPLIDVVCEHLSGRSVYLAQSLVDPSDDAGRAMLGALGFREMAELLYLQSTAPRALAQAEIMRNGIVHAITGVFTAAVIVAILAMLLTALIPSLPLENRGPRPPAEPV